MDLISVVIPIYNTELYLRECLDSVLAQSYQNLEIILVNDGSTDSSLNICNEYALKDRRIIVINKENEGVSVARNIGISKSNGAFISFVDSDDTIHQDLYKIMYETIIDKDVDRVMCGFMQQHGDKKVYRKTRVPDGIYETSDLLNKMIDDGTMSGFLFSGVYNSLYRSNVIKENQLFFNEEIKFNEDGLFNLIYAINTEKFYSLRSKPLYSYRIHSTSSTQKKSSGDKYSTLHKVLLELSENYPEYNFKFQIERRMATVALWEILETSKWNNFRSGTREINKILKRTETINGLALIDEKKLNKYKRFFYKCMKNNRVFAIYFTSKYVVPIMQGIVSR